MQKTCRIYMWIKINIQLTYSAISMQITNLMLNIYDECISNTNLDNFTQFIIYEIECDTIACIVCTCSACWLFFYILHVMRWEFFVKHHSRAIPLSGWSFCYIFFCIARTRPTAEPCEKSTAYEIIFQLVIFLLPKTNMNLSSHSSSFSLSSSSSLLFVCVCLFGRCCVECVHAKNVNFCRRF